MSQHLGKQVGNEKATSSERTQAPTGKPNKSLAEKKSGK